MKNSQRMLVKIIKEICNDENIHLECFSYDWILRLTRNNKVLHIFGYQFENNSATAQLLCTDKCAASELLLSRQIPAVEHQFFMSPANFQYTGAEGNWQKMLSLLNMQGKLVCKPNEGTGGTNVFLVSTPAELEYAVSKIFAHNRSLALSPYLKIENEYRLIVFNNEVKLVYSKNIPALTGDGNQTIRHLYLQYLQLHPEIPLENDVLIDVAEKIPVKNERIPINWKHNLGTGASPLLINEKSLIEKLEVLALKACNVLQVRFASVDIVQTGNEYLVLEINSGIMMEAFASTSPNNYNIAKQIYADAILTYLN